MTSSFAAHSSVKAQYDLTGKICLITGGAGFLGRQFAAAVGEMGATPVLLDVTQSELVKASEEVTSSCGRCEIEVGDVSEEQSLVEAVERVISRHGRVDILINNAALTKYGCDIDPDRFFSPFETGSTGVWNAGLRTNLTGVMLACKVIGPVMVRQGKGSIINLGSDVGVISPDQRIYERDDKTGYGGVPFNTPAFYSVSKAGVIHLTKHLATLWARNGVRVNCFSPAGVYRDHDPGFVEKLVERIPMGRMGAINEYKGAIVFLASDASSFMTGHNLVMDGGRSIW